MDQPLGPGPVPVSDLSWALNRVLAVTPRRLSANLVAGVVEALRPDLEELADLRATGAYHHRRLEALAEEVGVAVAQLRALRHLRADAAWGHHLEILTAQWSGLATAMEQVRSALPPAPADTVAYDQPTLFHAVA